VTYFKELSLYLLGANEGKLQQISVRIVFPGDIRTEHFSNTSRKHYRLSQLSQFAEINYIIRLRIVSNAKGFWAP
jgi:hypothetical protein